MDPVHVTGHGEAVALVINAVQPDVVEGDRDALVHHEEDTLEACDRDDLLAHGGHQLVELFLEDQLEVHPLLFCHVSWAWSPFCRLLLALDLDSDTMVTRVVIQPLLGGLPMVAESQSVELGLVLLSLKQDLILDRVLEAFSVRSYPSFCQILPLTFYCELLRQPVSIGAVRNLPPPSFLQFHLRPFLLDQSLQADHHRNHQNHYQMRHD